MSLVLKHSSPFIRPVRNIPDLSPLQARVAGLSAGCRRLQTWRKKIGQKKGKKKAETRIRLERSKWRK